MSHRRNFKGPESLFREISGQLFARQAADAISLIVYDQDAIRIRELLLTTGRDDFKRINYDDLPLGGLSLSGAEAAVLPTLLHPALMKTQGVRDRLYKEGAPLRFFTAYEQQLHLPLIDKKSALGTLTLHSKRPDTFPVETLQPFVLLANYLSMAMRLHAAEEENKFIEEERTRLLALGTALTTVRNKKDLAHVMQEEFRRLFPSGDIVICVVDEKKQTHSIFLFLPEPGRTIVSSPLRLPLIPSTTDFINKCRRQKMSACST